MITTLLLSNNIFQGAKLSFISPTLAVYLSLVLAQAGQGHRQRCTLSCLGAHEPFTFHVSGSIRSHFHSIQDHNRSFRLMQRPAVILNNNYLLSKAHFTI